MERETERLEFITKRDGIESAIEFARRGIKMYRCFSLKHHIHRDKLIESCICFHKFIKSERR